MKKIIRFLYLLLLVAISAYIICYFLHYFGIDNLNKLKDIINHGVIGSIIYVIFLTFQVLFLPMNTMFMIIPAILLFGSIKAYFLSVTGVFFASIIAYFGGRLFGEELSKWLLGDKDSKNFFKLLSQNNAITLFIVLLVPIFPDELMCFIAGTTKMQFKKFIIVSLSTRLIDMFFTCFVGAIIPFKGWWLLIWILIGVITLYLTYIFNKYKTKIEDKLSFNHNKIDK
jgi:uncharacterized membrane protein YdjX (TVP38/TMEM64 family)